jgi:thiol:disulfide interchange protein
MAFITAYLRNVSKHLNFLLLAVALVFPALLQAAEIEVVNQQIVASEDGYVLSADFNFELNQRLEEAVAKGVVLNFVAEFELSKPR